MATPPVFTAGQVLTAAQMNAVGLWLITKQTWSAASSVNVDNIFTSDYVNYRVIVEATNTDTNGLGYRFRASGSTDTGANYDFLAITVNTVATLGAVRDTGVTSINSRQNIGANNRYFQVSDIGNPNLAQQTNWQMLTYNTELISSSIVQGRHATAAAQDGLNLFVGAGTSTGTIWVYGYRSS